MTEPEKQLPSIEYSLKSISWHLKTIAEDLKKLRAASEKEADYTAGQF